MARQSKLPKPAPLAQYRPKKVIEWRASGVAMTGSGIGAEAVTRGKSPAMPGRFGKHHRLRQIIAGRRINRGRPIRLQLSPAGGWMASSTRQAAYLIAWRPEKSVRLLVVCCRVSQPPGFASNRWTRKEPLTERSCGGPRAIVHLNRIRSWVDRVNSWSLSPSAGHGPRLHSEALRRLMFRVGRRRGFKPLKIAGDFGPGDGNGMRRATRICCRFADGQARPIRVASEMIGLAGKMSQQADVPCLVSFSAATPFAFAAGAGAAPWLPQTRSTSCRSQRHRRRPGSPARPTRSTLHLRLRMR
jgi:hypothetical protein